MKKLFTLILSTIILGAYAQITVTNQDVAPAGTTFFTKIDTVAPEGISPGLPGANRVWDFTTLDGDYIDTLKFLLPSETPYADLFPEANFAGQLVDDNAFAYFIRNDDEFSAIGLVGSDMGYDEVSLPVDPKEIYMDFPVQYGNSRDENFSVSARLESNDPPADSIRFNQTTDKSTMVDAWGTLNLAIGSYDVLRIKESRTVYDSVWAHLFGFWTLVSNDVSNSTTYKWITNDVNLGYYLVTMDYDEENQSVGDVEYMFTAPVGIIENNLSDIDIYPNPFKNNIYFDNTANVSYCKIYDLSGKIVFQQETEGGKLDLSTLKNGFYVCEFLNENLEPMGRKKIIKE